MIAFERVVDAFRDAGLIVVERGSGVATAQAPGHSPADRSVSIRNIEGQVLIHCHSDETVAVLEAVGLTLSDLFDSPKGVQYTYDDDRIVNRTPGKKFYQSGNTAGRSLYRAHRLAAASIVFFVEGEKDVHAMESLGAVATCTAMGAGKAHLFDLTPLHGKTVIIVRDMDSAGLAHAEQVAELLADHAEWCMVCPAVGKDASDHIAAGRGLDEFVAIAEPMPEGPRKLSEVVTDWWRWLDAPPEQVRIFPTPWERLNEVIAGGLHPGRVYVIAGRPGGGKTIGLLNIAQHTGERQHPTIMFSLEMPELEMTSRLMASGAEANYGAITRREVGEYDRRKLELYGRGRVNETQLWLMDQATIDVEQIRAISGQMKRSAVGLDVVCIDYLGLVGASRGKRDRREVLGHIMKEAVRMAKELSVAVVLACQLNRGPEHANRAPVLSDLRETGDIEQDCDSAWLLHHPTMDGLPTGEVELHVAKNRTGARDVIVTLPWRPNYAKIGS
ncbi:MULTISPECIES: DnaB-like helicase C-terminal domain-containing protein [Nocardia]|uniref:DnaB-like helicase C-terminal domain-containing protein n=1 Tax=Nocardia TaxID=1817 RepID=UPI0013001A24|nr:MULTISPECIES: DnaB-like helicase C-terminal domain-containing protein [Nocardia]